MTCENPWREGPGHQLFSDSGELLEKAWLPWFQRCVWRRLLKKLGFSFVVCQFCFMITLSAAGFRVETLGIGETYQADLYFGLHFSCSCFVRGFFSQFVVILLLRTQSFRSRFSKQAASNSCWRLGSFAGEGVLWEVFGPHRFFSLPRHPRPKPVCGKRQDEKMGRSAMLCQRMHHRWIGGWVF